MQIKVKLIENQLKQLKKKQIKKIWHSHLLYISQLFSLKSVLSPFIEIKSNCDEKNYGLESHCTAVTAVDYQ